MAGGSTHTCATDYTSNNMFASPHRGNKKYDRKVLEKGGEPKVLENDLVINSEIKVGKKTTRMKRKAVYLSYSRTTIPNPRNPM